MASSSAKRPTGRRDIRAVEGGNGGHSGDAIVFDRRVNSSPVAVWAGFTDPVLLERWIGTWSGDPATGHVVFRMTSEGDDVSDEPVRILECRPGERLAVEIGVGAEGDAAWRLELSVAADADGGTVLRFAHLLDDTSGVGDIAPGWEYYLDRLTAVLEGGDPSLVLFEDYHPGMSEHYRSLFA